ncbi:MAG: hypothetical protein SPI49_03075 [Eubacteriales bacterium]|nr:hypothetical protein [Eubacteriales bacterium]
MIQVIAGKKGSGKTKRILGKANEASKDPSKIVIFIDDDNRYMYDLEREVRFVDAGEYDIVDDKMLLGFLSGVLTQNYDITHICIDAFKKLIKIDLSQSEWFFTRLEKLSEDSNVTFILSISEFPEILPEYIKKYII